MLESINWKKILSSMKTHKGVGNQSPIEELSYIIPARADSAIAYEIVALDRSKMTQAMPVQIVLISCVKRTHVHVVGGL